MDQEFDAAMMKQMRENTKVILWVVVIAFVITIFAVWGLDLQTGGGPQQTQNLVGRVNGVAVTPQTYQSVYNQISQQYRAGSTDEQIPPAQQEMMRDQAWESIVSNILTEQEIEKLRIGVTDEEVLAHLRSSPPPEVRSYFVDDAGNFDFAAYQAALNNPEADWTAVEALVRQRVPLIKLNQYLMTQVHVGAGEIRREFEEENIRLLANYVAFPVGDEDPSSYVPSEEEIASYYEAHADEFAVAEKATLSYIRVPLAPTGRDREDLAYTIRDLRDQIVAGESFETMAETYSEAFTARLGGDAGFVRAGQRPDEVLAAAAALAPGEVSGAVFTEGSAYLVQLVETRGRGDEAEYHIREIELALSTGAITTDSLSALAQDVQRRAVESGMDAAAAEYGLTVETSAPFTAGFPIPGLGLAPQLSRFAFANEPGTVSYVLGDGSAYYVCEVAQRLGAAVEPLDGVREGIVASLLGERRRQMATRKAEAFHRSVTASSRASLAGAAQQYQYAVVPTDTFTVRSRVGAIRASSAFQNAALALEAGAVSPPIEGDDAIYVIQLLYKSPFDTARFQEQAPPIRERIYQRRVQQYVAWWYEAIRKDSKIEDYRGVVL